MLLAVAAIVLATAVLPPVAAYAVNQRRIDRAGRDARALADRLRAPAEPGGQGAAVRHGPGRLPQAGSPDAEPWVAPPYAPLAASADAASIPSDPWGNSYLASDRWVLSAGPNGVVETPFRADAVVGDDVAVRR